MASPTIDQFLAEITGLIREKKGEKLRDYLQIEPPFPPLYKLIISELQKHHPPSTSPDILESKCKTFIPDYEDGEDGASLQSFITFMVKYLQFLRDVNVDQLVETHDLLKSLLKLVFMLLLTPGLLYLKITQPMYLGIERQQRSRCSTDRDIFLEDPGQACHRT